MNSGDTADSSACSQTTQTIGGKLLNVEYAPAAPPVILGQAGKAASASATGQEGRKWKPAEAGTLELLKQSQSGAQGQAQAAAYGGATGGGDLFSMIDANHDGTVT